MLAIGMTVCYNMEVYHGMGLHTKQVDAHQKMLAYEVLTTPILSGQSRILN